MLDIGLHPLLKPFLSKSLDHYVIIMLNNECFAYFQWDEDIEVSDITREYGDIEWLHHNIITQNNIDGIIVSTLLQDFSQYSSL